MVRLLRILPALKRRWGLFALLALYGYLTVHILSGSQGLASGKAYQRDAVRLRADLASVTAEREALEREAAALASVGLQLDVADQRAREVLFAARPEEWVILLHDPRKSAQTR